MSDTKKTWKEIVQESPEGIFDYRLTDKKITEGFLTHEAVEKHWESAPEEQDFDFTLADDLEEETEETV